MSSVYETGHDKNVAHFEQILNFSIGYGAAYNPSKIAIQIPALQTIHTDGLSVLSLVSVASSNFISATNLRYDEYLPIKALCTRIINALEATNASAAFIRDAKTINRKIQGSRVKKVINDTDPENPVIPSENTISTSQQSFDKILSNFRQLVDLLATEPLYTPNETELQVLTLNAIANTLASRNTAVIETHVALSNTRIQRDFVLYNEESGLVTTAYEVKKYVKSVFGASSPQYKQISGIKFTRPKK